MDKLDLASDNIEICRGSIKWGWTRDYISENWDLLVHKDLASLYAKIPRGYLEESASITYWLLKCDINPLDYMDYIPTCCFGWLNLKTFSVPSHIKHIDDFAFWMNEHLTDIVIPNSVDKIGNRALGNCARLERVTIPEKFKSKSDIFMGTRNTNFEKIDFTFI